MTAPPAIGSRTARWIRRGIALIVLVIVAAGGVWWALPSSGDATPSTGSHPNSEPDAVAVGPAWFRDATSGSGLTFTYRNGEEANHSTLLESLGGGVGLLDFDGDGLQDVFVAGGGYFDGPEKKQIKGYPCKLYRNLGNFQFEDVTAKVGLGIVDWWYTHGVAVADYDRDGWPDFVVTGYGRLELFHNESDGKGGRKFVAVNAEHGLKDDSWSTSAGWADLDGDGFPDLYVCRYCNWSFANHPECLGRTAGAGRDICPPQRFQPLEHLLFHNEKGTSFRRWSILEPRAKGHGLGVILADVNDDTRPDICVANDTTNNLLFLNRGGVFDEVAQAAGVAADEMGKPNGSMGADVGDYNGSGRPSIWVTNFQGESHALYLNLGRESFIHHSRAVGIAGIGQHFVGFGSGFVDANNDGWEDILILNGHVFHTLPSHVKQRPVLLQNVEREGRRFFQQVGPQTEPYFQTPAIGRGLALGDLNNDGWPDFIAVHTNTPVAVLRNVVAEHAPATWVGVKLMGRDNRDVVGSTVILETDTRRLVRFAKGGGSYMSAKDSRILFGLGTGGKVVRVTVKWSWGQTQTWEGFTPGRYWELREGQSAPLPLGAGNSPKG